MIQMDKIIDGVNLSNFKKLPNEDKNDYRARCYAMKEQLPGMTWEQLCGIMNHELGEEHWPNAYRRQYINWSGKKHVETAFNWETAGTVQLNEGETSNETDCSIIPNYIHDLNELNREIAKARVKLSDELTQNRAYIRKMAREETLLEMANLVAKEMSSKKMLNTPILPISESNVREGILCISDWHYGIEVDNYFNCYNPVVCCERLAKLRDEVISKGKELKFTKLHVVNLSDLISGRIHLQLRIENRYDTVSQIMHVSELVCEFLSDLSEYFEIEYRDCLDNHSRLEPNKKDSLELESLARIIPWYMQERLKNNPRIKVLYNTYADDIIDFKVFNFNVVAVHGHKDVPSKLINNMIAATRRRNDLVLSAHFHHFSADEEHECMRVSNGTLMGVDTHSQDLRLTNKPSQNLIIANKDNVTEFICKINL